MLNYLLKAPVDGVEEALINTLLAAESMTGANDLTVHELPEKRLQEILKKYNRLVE